MNNTLYGPNDAFQRLIAGGKILPQERPVIMGSLFAGVVIETPDGRHYSVGLERVDSYTGLVREVPPTPTPLPPLERPLQEPSPFTSQPQQLPCDTWEFQRRNAAFREKTQAEYEKRRDALILERIMYQRVEEGYGSGYETFTFPEHLLRQR